MQINISYIYIYLTENVFIIFAPIHKIIIRHKQYGIAKQIKPAIDLFIFVE